MEPIQTSFKTPKSPPFQSQGAWLWLRSNFFSSWFNTLISILLFYAIVTLGIFILEWAFVNAVWFGDSARSCPNSNGACWAFVTDRWRLFVYGLYPRELYWRVNIVYILASLTILSFLFSYGRTTKIFRLLMITIFPVAAYILLIGNYFGLKYVSPEDLGGLLLTLVIASISILGSIPLGLFLALGRMSKLTVISKLCMYFIEFWRGVPHIVIIVMFVALLPIFIPLKLVLFIFICNLQNSWLSWGWKYWFDCCLSSAWPILLENDGLYHTSPSNAQLCSSAC